MNLSKVELDKLVETLRTMVDVHENNLHYTEGKELRTLLDKISSFSRMNNDNGNWRILTTGLEQKMERLMENQASLLDLIIELKREIKKILDLIAQK